jgi:hypothetical protein
MAGRLIGAAILAEKCFGGVNRSRHHSFAGDEHRYDPASARLNQYFETHACKHT